MTITCPHCAFAKEVDPAGLPDKPLKVTCPRCRQVFSYRKPALPATEAFAVAAEESSASTLPPSPPGSVRHRVCSACGAVQPTGNFCTSCGATFMATAALAASYRFAGFWIRAVAILIDSLLVGLVQVVCGFALAMLGGAMAEDDLMVSGVTSLFGLAISTAYYVFFTGYCGQTPGKMALRIKVIRTDGSELSYGRAFLREAVGKFISAVILGIGYLMAAFDARKQALHDRMADTYVIKL